MAAPLALALKTGIVAAEAGGILDTLQNFNPLAWFSPLAALTRERLYANNWRYSNVVPAPAQLVHAYYARKLTNQQLYNGLGWHGIHWGYNQPLAELSDNRQTWRHIVDLAEPNWEPATWLHWYRQGRVSDVPVYAALDQRGISRTDRKILYATSYENLPPETALDAWRQKKLSDEELTRALVVGGFTRAAERNVLIAMSDWPSREQIMDLVNRDFLTPADATDWLRAAGVVDPVAQAALLALRHQIPGPGDLVRMAVRDVWSREVVERFGYDAEWDEQNEFRHWMNAQGYGHSAEIPGGAPGAPETWPQAYWRAHWQLPSPTQVYTMLHRLRPDSMARWPAEYAGAAPVTIDDVRLLLRTADYPPAWRDRLAAISYSLPPLRTMRRIVDTAVTQPGAGAVIYPGPGWAAADAAEAAGDLPGAREARAGLMRQRLNDFYRDRGLTQETARTFAEHDLYEARISGSETEPRRLARLVRRWAEAILRRYRLGLLGRADAEAALAEVGWGPQSRRIALDLESSTRDEQLVRAGVARLRGDYNAGRLAAIDARQRLRDIGLSEAAIENHVARWQAARTEPLKRLETAGVIRAVTEGLLSVPVAAFRLSNLGWSRPDALLLLAGAAGRLQQRSASALRADLLSRDKAARALAKQSRDAAAQARKLQARVRQLTPPSKLIRWFARGRINESYLRRRLADMGDPPEVIALTVAEAQAAADAELKREHPRKREVKVTTTPAGTTTKTVTKTREDTSGPVTRIHVTKRSEHE